MKINHTRKLYFGFAATLLISSSCKQANVADGSDELAAQGRVVPGTGEDGKQRKKAYNFVKESLSQARRVNTKTEDIGLPDNASPEFIINSLNMPLRNPMKTPEDRKRGETPKMLQGVFWMRGNPLPDYLISFANMIWGEVNLNDKSRVGYLPTYLPGSFIWKPKSTTTAAIDETDYKSLPEVCKMPVDENLRAGFANKVDVKASLAFDRNAKEYLGELEPNPDLEQEIASHRDATQMDLEGATALKILSKGKVFYEAKFTDDYKNVEVLVFSSPLPFVKLVAPNMIAAFSYAPYLNADGSPDLNRFMRKTHISGLSKKGTPHFYAFTRIIDANGKPIQPYYGEFLKCVQERSKGRVLVPVPDVR